MEGGLGGKRGILGGNELRMEVNFGRESVVKEVNFF